MQEKEILPIFECPACHYAIQVRGIPQDWLAKLELSCIKCQKILLQDNGGEKEKNLLSKTDKRLVPLPVTQDHLALPMGKSEPVEKLESRMAVTAEMIAGKETMPLKVADYQIIKQLGQGAMGIILLGEHTVTKKKAALKLLVPDMQNNEKAVQRFLQEAKVHSRLNHPNIVKVYDVGYCGNSGKLYIAMEYVDGYSLEVALNKRGPLSVRDALKIAIVVGNALESALQESIIHRDLKPANILIDTVGRKVKVADFGLGKILAEKGITLSNQILGTLYYMPPEQITNAKEADQRADIYALGATLYHMLSGRPPYSEFKGTFAIVRAKSKHEATPIEEYVTDLAPAVVKILQKCMENDMQKRYETPTLLVQDLQKALARLA